LKGGNPKDGKKLRADPRLREVGATSG
jgi:hypothetical protein